MEHGDNKFADDKISFLQNLKQYYVSAKLVKRLQDTDESVEKSLKSFLNIHPRQLAFAFKEDQVIARSQDGTKVAVSCSYHFAHFLNYDIVYRLRVFDVATRRAFYSLDCLEKPICHLKFANNNTLRAYYKGSEYVGSDTVQEWNLSGDTYTIN